MKRSNAAINVLIQLHNGDWVVYLQNFNWKTRSFWSWQAKYAQQDETIDWYNSTGIIVERDKQEHRMKEEKNDLYRKYYFQLGLPSIHRLDG